MNNTIDEQQESHPRADRANGNKNTRDTLNLIDSQTAINFEFHAEPSAPYIPADKLVRFPPEEVVAATVKRIVAQLRESLPDCNSRVAMKFLVTKEGFGWEGAVLLVPSEGDMRSPIAVGTTFAAKAIEVAVDLAVRTNRIEPWWPWEDEDARVPVTSVVDQQATKESSAIVMEGNESRLTRALQRLSLVFITAIFALLLSAMAFSGFAYLIFRDRFC